MQEAGFLGTAAPRAADVVLLLEMGMGTGLLAGALFARARWYRLHAACQSAIVLLNLALGHVLPFIAVCSQSSQAGLESPTTRSPQPMRLWAALLRLRACIYF